MVLVSTVISQSLIAHFTALIGTVLVGAKHITYVRRKKNEAKKRIEYEIRCRKIFFGNVTLLNNKSTSK